MFCLPRSSRPIEAALCCSIEHRSCDAKGACIPLQGGLKYGWSCSLVSARQSLPTALLTEDVSVFCGNNAQGYLGGGCIPEGVIGTEEQQFCALQGELLGVHVLGSTCVWYWQGWVPHPNLTSSPFLSPTALLEQRPRRHGIDAFRGNPWALQWRTHIAQWGQQQ